MGEEACVLKSGGMMRMTGGGGILLRAPEITVSTPLEINHLKSREHAVLRGSRMGAKGSRNPATGGDTSLSMQYEFNGLAAQGILQGTAFEKYKAFDDAPDYEGDYPIGLKIAAGVAVALVVGAAVGATGGLPIPFLGRVIMPEQIYALSQIAGWGLNAENLGFQFLDLAMFLISGKELGTGTGIGWLDRERNKTEVWADILSYYGLWNPFTYQKPTVVQAPVGVTGETDLMVPDVPADNSGEVMIPLPNVVPVPEQAGSGLVTASPKGDIPAKETVPKDGTVPEGGSKLEIEEVIPPGSTHPVKVYTDGNAQINTGKIDIYIFVVRLNWMSKQQQLGLMN